MSPSCVKVASLPAPKLIKESSLINFRLSPITALSTTDNPPFVCNDPFVVVVASVLSPHSILPLAVIFPADVTVTPDEPLPPAISKSPLSSTLKTSVPLNCLKTKSEASAFNFIITSPGVPSISSDNLLVPPS